MGQDDKALTFYSKVLETPNPWEANALYFEAVIFEKRGNASRSKALLNSIRTASLSAEMKLKVLAFKNYLYAEAFEPNSELEADYRPPESSSTQAKITAAQPTLAQTPSRLNLLFDLAEGWNSNPGVLPDGQSQPLQGDSQTQVRGGLDGQIWASRFHELRFGYSYSGTYFGSQTSYNYDEHDIVLPLLFYFANFRLKLVPIYIVQGFAGSPFADQKGGNVELAYRDNTSTFYGLGYQAMSIANLNPSYNYLSGQFAKVYAFSEKHWSESKFLIEFSSSHFASAQNDQVVGASNRAFDLLLSYNRYLQSWDFGASFMGENRAYTEAPSDTQARVDWRETLDLQLGYSFTSQLRFYLDLAAASNQSNMQSSTANYSYNQATALLGLSSRFGRL
jgi:hypothetical protein